MSKEITSKKQHSVWFWVSLVLCIVILLTSLISYLASMTFLFTDQTNHTYIRHNVSLVAKVTKDGQLAEVYQDPLHFSRKTLTPSDREVLEHPAGEKGTLVFRNGKVVVFQSNSVKRQNQQEIKNQVKKLNQQIKKSPEKR